MAVLICAVLLVLSLGNLWQGFARGRILAHYGMAPRDDPYRFWSGVVFSGFAAALFGVLLAALLDPRDFKPVLRIVSCKRAVMTCIQAELKGAP